MQSQAARPAPLAITITIAIILAMTLATPAARAQHSVTLTWTACTDATANQAAVLIPAPILPQQSACTHRGSLAAWLRCVASVQHSQPKRGKPSP